MATLEDKLLGDKVHNYCSSSSSGGEDSDSDGEEASGAAPVSSASASASAPPQLEPTKWEGTATNTGPKGVIKDWQRFKQLESEKRAEQERERVALMRKLTLSCRSALDEERERAKEEDPELADLLHGDDFLFQFQKQRMQELLSLGASARTFGRMHRLHSAQDFLDAVDREQRAVTVVVHIFEEGVEACAVMNECLEELCADFPAVKFCSIVGSQAGVSKRFKVSGVPALLVYKAGQLVGNFVRVSDDLGDNFSADELQAFLTEHGMLLDKTFVPQILAATQ